MKDESKVHGQITIYKVKANGDVICLIDKHNTIHANMHNAFANSLITRNNDASIDYQVWGSYSDPAGTFIDGTYVGTGASGTNGLLSMSLSGSSARFLGTFNFLATKQINYFQMGRGYNSTGVSSLVTTPYALDKVLLTGSTWITYLNGEQLIMDWTVTVGI